MSTLSLEQRIKGRVVFVKDGKEVPEGTDGAKARINGPHHEAKWALHATGSDETAGQRKRRLMLACKREYEITLTERQERIMNYAKPTTKPVATVPRGLGKAMKGIKTT